jgi:hypothetical protein
MHAMLAMSGSHLDLMADDRSPNLALTHRQKAIEGLEGAFARWPPKSTEAHVMLATSYLLAFQASYLSDGMLEHILSLRGCAMLSQMINSNGFEGAFSVLPDLRGKYLSWKTKEFPCLDPQLALEALQSMRELSLRLVASAQHPLERQMLGQLVECVRPLLVAQPSESPATSGTSNTSTPGLTDHTSKSVAPEDDSSTIASPDNTPPGPTTTREILGLFKYPLYPFVDNIDIDSMDWDRITEIPSYPTPDPLRAFNGLMGSLNILTASPRELVLDMFGPTNVIGNILMLHFCCTRFIMAPLCAPESAMKTPLKAMLEWCEKMVDGIKDEEGDGVKWSTYVQWPRKIFKTMRCCLNLKKGLMFSDLYDILMNNPKAFTEGTLELPRRDK